MFQSQYYRLLKDNRGEVATILTLVSFLLVAAGTILGSYIAQRETRIISKAGNEECIGKPANYYIGIAPEKGQPGKNGCDCDTVNHYYVHWHKNCQCDVNAGNCPHYYPEVDTACKNQISCPFDSPAPTNPQPTGSGGGGGGTSGTFHLTSSVNPKNDQNLAEGCNVDITFVSDGCDGDIRLDRNGQMVAGINGWNSGTGPFTYYSQWTGSPYAPGTTVIFTGWIVRGPRNCGNQSRSLAVTMTANCRGGGGGGGTTQPTPTPTHPPNVAVPTPTPTVTPIPNPNQPSPTPTPTLPPGIPTPTIQTGCFHLTGEANTAPYYNYTFSDPTTYTATLVGVNFFVTLKVISDGGEGIMRLLINDQPALFFHDQFLYKGTTYVIMPEYTGFPPVSLNDRVSVPNNTSSEIKYKVIADGNCPVPENTKELVCVFTVDAAGHPSSPNCPVVSVGGGSPTITSPVIASPTVPATSSTLPTNYRPVDYQKVMAGYTSGAYNAVQISEWLSRATNTPGIKIKTCDPLKGECNIPF
jgi:hypothetical protein